MPSGQKSRRLLRPPRIGRLAFALGIAPLVVLALVSIVTFVDGLNTGSIGFDFRGAYLSAAHAILDGESPYPPVEGPALASQTAYVYPPLLAYLVVPFTVLPEAVASDPRRARGGGAPQPGLS